MTPTIPNGSTESPYKTTVPDTLDLADRAALALHGLAETLDKDANYELWLRADFTKHPVYMWHENTGMPTNNPKYAESFAMMRVMCGGEEHMDVQQGMIKALVSLIAEDGLYYVPAGGRPWHETSGHTVEVVTNEDFANVYGNSRVLLAMTTWMQYSPDGPWREKAAGVAQLSMGPHCVVRKPKTLANRVASLAAEAADAYASQAQRAG